MTDEQTDPTAEDGYYNSYGYFAGIASLLLAGDIQARVVANSAGEHSVEVKLIDDSRVLWSNARGAWGYSIITEDDVVAKKLPLSRQASVDAVAQLIATTSYPVPVSYPAEHPGDDL